MEHSSMDQDFDSVALDVTDSPGLRVLLVEDDEADAYLIGQVLSDHPRVSEVIHVKDGEAALAALANDEMKPDVAILDLHMPRKNGFSVLLDLAPGDRDKVPVVVLTSSRIGADKLRAIRRGAGYFLTKPNSIAKLAQALDPIMAAI